MSAGPDPAGGPGPAAPYPAEPGGGLSAELTEALARFAAHERVLIALDFDGVLAELVERAEDARPVPENATALDELTTAPGVHTALVSGRALESLTTVATPPDASLLIGSHGAERRLGPDAPPLTLDEAQHSALRSAQEALDAIAARYPGSWVEHKPAGRVLHVRQVASADEAGRALEEAAAALQVLEGVHVGHGKGVVESAVVRADKGQGLDLLRETTGAQAVLFAGDDVTDEAGFARLREGTDVGIKVGEGPTAAPWRISGPAQVAAVLRTVRRLRTEADAGPWPR